MTATKGGAAGGKPREAQQQVNRMLLYIFALFFVVLAGLGIASGLGLI